MAKKLSRARIQYYMDIIIGISFLVVAVSGIILFFAGSGGYQGGRNPRYAREIMGLSRTLWKDLHDWGGILMTAGVLGHLALHWRWLIRMTRNVFKKPIRTPGKPKQSKLENCPAEG